MQSHVCTCTLSAVYLLQPHVSTCTLSAARVISLCTASHSQPPFGLHSLSTAPLSNELCVLSALPLCLYSCLCPQKSRKLPPTWKYESSTASALVA